MIMIYLERPGGSTKLKDIVGTTCYITSDECGHLIILLLFLTKSLTFSTLIELKVFTLAYEPV